MKICSKESCFGCWSCFNACNQHAISMQLDEHGYYYPNVDDKKCILCNKCKSVCPAISNANSNDIISCYAAWNKKEEIVNYAASAGVVSAIYEWTISEGGVIYGTEYLNGSLVFESCNQIESIRRFQGSKYVQAIINDAFYKIKLQLLSGTLVTFVGTPCQVAGLKLFLKRDYKNLILIDLICHGVSSQKYLKDYIFSITKKNYDKALFRGEYGNKLVAFKNSSIIYIRNKEFDGFSMAYAKGLISRPSCYQCPYCSIRRQGDFTTGDFWGLKRNDLKKIPENIKYISLLLVNSVKGEELLNVIKNKIYVEKRDILEAIKGNMQLSMPPEKNCDRDKFLKRFSKIGFMSSLKKTRIYKKTKKKYYYYLLKEYFKRELK